MRIQSRTLIPLTILFGLAAAPALRPAPAAAAKALPAPEVATYDKDIKPLLDEYCYGCHGAMTHAQRLTMENETKAKSDAEKELQLATKDQDDADKASDAKKSGEAAQRVAAASQKIDAAQKALDDLKSVTDPKAGGDQNGIHLASFDSVADILNHTTDVWALALHNLSTNVMPPPDSGNLPSKAERDLLVGWLDRQIYKYDPTHPDPGLVPIHRLNRAEYNNTVRDLLGVDFHPADDFPADDSSFGFDNMAEALSLPPMLLDKYYKAADKVVDSAIPTEHLLNNTWHFDADQADVGVDEVGDTGDGWVQISGVHEGDIAVNLNVPTTGVYTLSFQAYGKSDSGNATSAAAAPADPAADPAADAPAAPASPPVFPVVSLMVGDVVERDYLIAGTDFAGAPKALTADAPFTFQAQVTLQAGKQRIHVKMLHKRGGENEQVGVNQLVGPPSDGVAMVKYIQVEGPLMDEVTQAAAGETVLKQNGEADYKYTVAAEGDYVLRAYVTASEAGDTFPIMDLRVNGESYQTVFVVAPGPLQNGNFTDPVTHQKVTVSDQALKPIPRMYEIHAHLMPGETTFGAAFLNAYTDASNPNPNRRARALTVERLEIANPTAAPIPAMSDVMKKTYFTQNVTAANKTAVARDILTKFALHAWRQPAAKEQIDGLMSLFADADANGQSFEAAMKLPMKAVLVSSRFLFRGEAPQTGAAAHLATVNTGNGKMANLSATMTQGQIVKTAAASPSAPAAGGAADNAVPIDEYALASRLSYFLWSSMPDDELLDLASKNQLRAKLTDEVKRMIASPKSHALVDNFASQWLQFRALADRDPDKGIYPTYNNNVRNDMETETGMFFDYIMHQNRSVLEFLTADYTFINERLAKFYGLPDVAGDGFQKVSLNGSPRLGVLTQGSVLVLTSNPSRTSPVKRGKWVLENLLGYIVPPPPPNVDLGALDKPGVNPDASLRERMVAHRADTLCASCHGKMDPIGLSLENFDGVGAFRTNERKADGSPGAKIDISGELATGEKFVGSGDLIKILSSSKRDDFYLNVVQKVMTYAVGRGIEDHSSDRAACDKIVEQMKTGDDKFMTVIMGVINSMPFQEMRHPAAGQTAGSTAATPKVSSN